ncbi:MAG: prephenate dehydrogenase [Candidatus Omnitrophota bacterium]
MSKIKLKTVGIVGVGFMGGSLALAVKDAFPSVRLWGYARSRKSFNKIKRLSLVDVVTMNLEELARESDLIILATPVSTIIDYFKKLSPYLKKGSFVIDLGSTKKIIDKMAKIYIPPYVSFVGCHPLCGSHKSGPAVADKDLYKGSLCIITSRSKAAKFIREFWQGLGCSVFYVNSSLHDKMLSYISHIPHIISFSFAYFVPDKYGKFASRSFRDLTRIASSPADVWADILLSNRRNIIKGIRGYSKILRSFETVIKNQDRDKLLRIIKTINLKRARIGQ